eukprot:3593158-Alexandrium_andersonii.AAC.1
MPLSKWPSPLTAPCSKRSVIERKTITQRARCQKPTTKPARDERVVRGFGVCRVAQRVTTIRAELRQGSQSRAITQNAQAQPIVNAHQ